MYRSKLVYLMERYHEYFHLGFGIFAFGVTICIFPGYSPLSLLIVAAITSYLPDIDHLFFMFIYGRRTSYSQSVRSLLKAKKYHEALEFCRQNHKHNHFILSHNLLTPIISLFLFFYFVMSHHPILSVFFMSWTMHYVFDIVEDFLALGKLNPNWYLKFSVDTIR